MNGTTERREILVGVDPTSNSHLALAWAADEAHRRRSALRLVVAVPPRHDTHHVDDTPGTRHGRRRAGRPCGPRQPGRTVGSPTSRSLPKSSTGTPHGCSRTCRARPPWPCSDPGTSAGPRSS
ncbi:universal stress protein [Streptomyces venezuelae ATCC 10712]